MSKFTKGRIEAATQIINKIAAMKEGCNSQDYITARIELNAEIIQAVIGGKIVSKETKKNGTVNKIRYTEKLASREELAQIIAMLAAFEADVEEPILAAFNRKLNEMEADENMDIVPAIAMIDEADIPNFQKISTKSFNKAIIGESQNVGIIGTGRISSYNIMELAAQAEALRKKQNLHKVLIVGGIVITAAAAGVATKMIIDKKKRDNEAILEDVAGEDVDLDSSSVDLPESDADLDVPVVTLD